MSSRPARAWAWVLCLGLAAPAPAAPFKGFILRGARPSAPRAVSPLPRAALVPAAAPAADGPSSELLLPPAGLPAAPAPVAAPGLAAPDPAEWARLEERAARAIGFAPGRSLEWARRTAELLRDDPAASLDAAMGRALAEVHALPAEIPGWMFSAELLEPELTGERIWRVKRGAHALYALGQDGRVHENAGAGWTLAAKDASLAVGPDGRTYLAVPSGVYRREASGWVPLPGRIPKTDRVSLALDRGRLYLIAAGGLYRYRKGRWVSMRPLLTEPGTATSFHQRADGLYFVTVSGDDWHYADHELRKIDGAFSRPVFSKHNTPITGVSPSGPLYVTGYGGTYYERRGPGWRWNSSARVAGFLESDDGLYGYSSHPHKAELMTHETDGTWKKDPEELPFPHAILTHAGRRFLATSGGVFERIGGRWKLRAAGKFLSAFSDRGTLYLPGENGLMKAGPLHPGFSDDWRARLTAGISALIGGGGGRAPPEGRRDGRSGFRRRAPPVLGPGASRPGRIAPRAS